MCTENLTLWLKLLRCRGAAGIAALLERSVVNGALYHSSTVTMSVRPSRHQSKSSKHNDTLERSRAAAADVQQYTLTQTLTLVVDINARKPWPSNIQAPVNGSAGIWSLQEVFGGNDLAGSCPYASASKVHLHLPAWAQQRAHPDSDPPKAVAGPAASAALPRHLYSESAASHPARDLPKAEYSASSPPDCSTIHRHGGQTLTWTLPRSSETSGALSVRYHGGVSADAPTRFLWSAERCVCPKTARKP